MQATTNFTCRVARTGWLASCMQSLCDGIAHSLKTVLPKNDAGMNSTEVKSTAKMMIPRGHCYNVCNP
jgi:hypothetical protein